MKRIQQKEDPPDPADSPENSRLWISLVLLALILLFSGSLWADLALGARERQIRVGLFAPLSGAEQASGKALLEGATLAIGELNERGGVGGTKWVLIAKDDGGPELAGQILRDLAEKEKCLVAIGSPQTATVLAAMPFASEHRIPLLVPNGDDEIAQRGNDWIFRVGAYDQLAAACIATFVVQELKWERIAILHEKEEFGAKAMKGFSRALRKLGKSPILVSSFTRGDRDFTIQISKILKKTPDGWAIWGLSAETAHLAKELRQMGHRGVIVGSPDVADSKYIAMAGPAGDNTLFAAPLIHASRNAVAVRFSQNFQSRFGYPSPSVHAASGYDAIMLVAKAVEGVKLFMDRRGIRDALSAIANCELTQGSYTFKNSQGNGLRSLSLQIYLSGHPVLLHDQYRPDPRTLGR